MMNLVALGLVFSSLAAAGVWSPQPDRPPAVAEDPRAHHPPGDAVVREGHRLIVLEYERQTPQQQPTPSQALHPPSDHGLPAGFLEEAKERFKEAASVLPNLVQGASTPEETQEGAKAALHGAKEKVCDAVGVCKEKIAGLFGNSKEKAAQMEEAAREAVAGAVEKAREVKEDVAGNVSEAARGAAEKGREMARGVTEKAREVGGNVTEKAVEVGKNLTEMLQRAGEVAREAGAAVAGVVHLLAFATAYGACVWVTFVSSHVLARALPRQQFGVVQSKLYPVYFRAMAYAVGVALLSHAFPPLGPAGRRSAAAEALQGYNLLASLGLLLVNMHFLEPRATKVMFGRMKMEKEEGRGRDMADVDVESTRRTVTAPATAAVTPPTSSTRVFGVTETTAAEQEVAKRKMAELNRRLKSLNAYSSLLNVMTLMGLTWHLVHLSRRLQVASC